jgi:hypothetical protein
VGNQRRRLQRLSAGLALTVGAGFLGAWAREGVTLTQRVLTPHSIRDGAAQYDQLACLERSLRRLVRPGQRVFVDPGMPRQWEQLAYLAAFPGRLVAPTAEEADVVFALRADPDDACRPGAFVAAPPAPGT